MRCLLCFKVRSIDFQNVSQSVVKSMTTGNFFIVKSQCFSLRKWASLSKAQSYRVLLPSPNKGRSTSGLRESLLRQAETISIHFSLRASRESNLLLWHLHSTKQFTRRNLILMVNYQSYTYYYYRANLSICTQRMNSLQDTFYLIQHISLLAEL